jgi:Conserved TM helix/Mechanosensitive ion channel
MGFKILESLLLRLVNAIPNIIAAIAIALIGMLIAKAIAKLVERLLSTIGIDALASKLNDIDVVQQYNINFKPSHIVGQIFYYVLMLVFLIAATDVLGMPAVSQLISDLINYVPNIITAMIVLIIGLLVANGLKGIVYSTCKSVGIPSANLVANFVFYFVFLTALISGLAQAKIDTDFVKANLSIILGGGVAAFALGYGLASRDMMSNFLASFYSRRHFNIGDTIKVGAITGIIVYEDNTCIKMQSGDRLIVIPLNKLMNNEVEILPSGRAELPENQ